MQKSIFTFIIPPALTEKVRVRRNFYFLFLKEKYTGITRGI